MIKTTNRTVGAPAELVKFPTYGGINLIQGDITQLYVDCLVCHAARKREKLCDDALSVL